MFTSLELRNFKSWAATRPVRLAPITGLFGANSSGKTSLLQSFLLLKQTVDSADRGLALQFGDKKSLVDLGDFRSVVHRHQVQDELVFSLGWKQGTPFTARNPKGPGETIVESSDLAFTTRVMNENGDGKAPRLAVPEISYRVGDVTFGTRRKRDDPSQYELYSDGTGFAFLRLREGRKWPLPAPTKCYGFPDQARAYYQNAGFLSDLELALEEQLRRTYYLGPLRAYPERTYAWSGA